jgi:hypothetical protein
MRGEIKPNKHPEQENTAYRNNQSTQQLTDAALWHSPSPVHGHLRLKSEDKEQLTNIIDMPTALSIVTKMALYGIE